jgi:putative FmdB family regulatory protein
MPIFEYICKQCHHQFEVIVQGGGKVECPSCRSKKLEKQLSVFAAGTKTNGFDRSQLPVGPCGSCGDPRGPGSCSLN